MHSYLLAAAGPLNKLDLTVPEPVPLPLSSDLVRNDHFLPLVIKKKPSPELEMLMIVVYPGFIDYLTL